VTSREFAKLIGVSQSTVSRAMNNSDLVPEEKRKYIHQKAKEYGFVLNNHAKSLRTRRTGTIGILFPKHFVGMSSNMMLAHLYDSIQREMHNYDYDIMVIHYKPETDDFSTFERIVRTEKVDGFLVLRMELSPKEMQLIEEYQVPCVFLLNASSKIRSNLNYLFSDSEHGGFLAGEYLGGFPEYEKFAFSLNQGSKDAERRMAGYRRGLQSRGCSLPEENLLRCDLSIESAYDCFMENRARFAGHKSAVFAHNDMLGVGIVNACRALGYPIPEQVQLIGMDDIPLAEMLHPKLSTLHVAVEDMVPRGCALLIELINRNDQLIQEWIKPTLVLRETTL